MVRQKFADHMTDVSRPVTIKVDDGVMDNVKMIISMPTTVDASEGTAQEKNYNLTVEFELDGNTKSSRTSPALTATFACQVTNSGQVLETETEIETGTEGKIISLYIEELTFKWTLTEVDKN